MLEEIQEEKLEEIFAEKRNHRTVTIDRVQMHIEASS